MPIWLVRAGSQGEYESKFLTEGRVYLTWEALKVNLQDYPEGPDLKAYLQDFYDDLYGEMNPKTISNWNGQIWAFAHAIAPGDWVVLPSKPNATLHFGRVTSDYRYQPEGPDPYYHYRTVEWFGRDIPRTAFDQDILYSFGAFLTVCRIQRNDAEERIKAMAERGWQSALSDGIAESPSVMPTDETSAEGTDYEEKAKIQIEKLLERKFKGHGLAELVNALLKAKGYYTKLSAPGPDGGVDIYAQSPLGSYLPGLIVQVKSGGTTDLATVDRLEGLVSRHGADQGLFVSWNGFKNSIDQQSQFFKIHFWTSKEIIEEFQRHYPALPLALRELVPLKQVWMVDMAEEQT